MALDIKIYSGVAQKWNISPSANHLIYSSIEFEGGKKIGDIQITQELNDVLEPALGDGQPLNLHVVMPMQGVPATLIAFEKPGERLSPPTCPRFLG